MLKNYFTRTRFSGFLLLTILAVITWLVYFFFISHFLQQKSDDFTHLYSEDCPEVIFDHGTVRMNGTVPFIHQNQAGVTVLFDTTGQITGIPTDAAVGSILITDQMFIFRSSSKDHDFPVRKLDIERLVVSHTTIQSFLDKYLKKFLSILAFGGFVVFWAGTLLLVLIGSGIMLGVDYLFGGKKNGTVIFNLASVLLVPTYSFWWFHRIYDLGMSHLLTTIFLLYILTIAISTAALRNFLNEPDF